MQMNIIFSHEHVSPQPMLAVEVVDLWPVQCAIALVRAFAKDVATWEGSGFSPLCWLDHDEITEIAMPQVFKATAELLRKETRLFTQSKLEDVIMDCLQMAYINGFESVKPYWRETSAGVSNA